jgi:hypothetical protein
MKTNILLMTTILGAGLLINGGVIAQTKSTDNITTKTVTTATKPITNEEISDPTKAAESFVEHVNYARVALAMKNTDLAKQHISKARDMITVIKNVPPEKRVINDVETGRLTYKYDTQHKYHYFPIETGQVKVKQMSNGPVWSTKTELAVTDADIVYMTLDLSGDKADKYLNDAEKAISSNDLKEADNQLAELTDSVVELDSKVAIPSVKAHDNISLARNFLAEKNYEGASFALKHADEALDEMQKDVGNKVRSQDIINMRKDVSDLQGYISQKDPTLIDKADKKIDKWWGGLKSWTLGNK